MPSNSSKKERPLSVKQVRFIDGFILHNGNGTEASRYAGYKGSDNALAVQASQNLRKPHIHAAIDLARRQAGQDSGLDKEALFGHLQRIIWDDGADRVNAVRLAAQMQGLIEDKRSVRHSGAVLHGHKSFEGLSEPELRRLANRGQPDRKALEAKSAGEVIDQP